MCVCGLSSQSDQQILPQLVFLLGLANLALRVLHQALLERVQAALLEYLELCVKCEEGEEL